MRSFENFGSRVKLMVSFEKVIKINYQIKELKFLLREMITTVFRKFFVLWVIVYFVYVLIY